ncbi:MAG: chlororespiratory reduction protein 7 [Spirulinaceae cyanobacterium RM2_2_10]|nr:chlororespiratory reduction protein 7 [Spirulinaceae cyanobacterium SM2_1_0]NJO19393.1 chlororespiratory reduction protein 7 [Spirulinaceae cyanobacterium RM2_2_10]
MPDALMYQEDVYVVLEADQPEVFLTPAELLAKLQSLLQTTDPEELPRELQQIEALGDRARHLMETYCEFDCGAGHYLQWYVTRLEREGSA